MTTCIVPGCNSNYHNQIKFTSIFSFPNDIVLREKWFRAIPRPREDYEMNKHLKVNFLLLHNLNLILLLFIYIFKVCIHHFHEEDIERTFLFHDGTKMVEMVKKKITLKKSAVPSIFPNCPSYLTDVATKPQRLSWHDKEQKRVQEACEKSRIDHGETEAKFIVSTLSCIFSKLYLIQLPNGWLTHQPNFNTIIFLKIQFDSNVSTIDRSIIVDENLFCKAFYRQTYKIELSCHTFNDIRSLENTIHEVELFEMSQDNHNYSSSSATPLINHIENAIHNISSAIDTLEPSNSSDLEIERDSMRIRLNFLLDQLKYLIVDKHGRRYNILTQVFSLKIHGISPACYRLIQGSNCLILPHERNLLKIKNTIGLESEYTKILKEVATTFNDLERHVILQMDEVHIRSDASYKGGRVIGSIDNPDDPHTTVFDDGF